MEVPLAVVDLAAAKHGAAFGEGFEDGAGGAEGGTLPALASWRVTGGLFIAASVQVGDLLACRAPTPAFPEVGRVVEWGAVHEGVWGREESRYLQMSYCG